MTERKEISSAFGELETTETLTMDQIEAKACDLLAQLSLDEKIGLMCGDTPFWPGFADMMGGGYSQRPWPAGGGAGLGIPGIRLSDGPRQIGRASCRGRVQISVGAVSLKKKRDIEPHRATL